MAVKDTKPPVSRKADAPLSELYKEEKPSPFSIEGIRSGAVQSKIFKGFILLSGLVMAGGLIISGLNPSGGAPPPQGSAPTAMRETVATVGDQKISGSQLANTFAQQQQFNAQFGQPTGVANYLSSKQSALERLTGSAATVIAAQNAGITVSDAEIDAEIDKQIGNYLKPQQGQSEAAFRRSMEAQFGSLQGARDKMKENLPPEAREQIRSQLMAEKLEKQVKDQNRASEDDYKRSVTKLKLWQIVVRPKLAAATDKAASDKANSEAKTRAAKVLAALKANATLANFKATAQKSSDDPATKTKGGDLGWKLPSDIYYAPEIGDALSKTEGSLAGPFQDSSGTQYLFFIENRKTELPKDFAKNKAKLLADYETQADDTAWQKKQEEYKKAATPQISDPALVAFRVQSGDLPAASGEAQKTLRENAIARYNEALKGASGTEAAAIHYQLAQLFREQNNRQKQEASLAQAVKEAGEDTALRLEYARLLRENGKTKEVLAQLKAASKALDDSPPAPPPFGGANPGDAIRRQIAGGFAELKETKLAQAELAKIKPAPQGMGGMGGMSGLPPGVQIQPGR